MGLQKNWRGLPLINFVLSFIPDQWFKASQYVIEDPHQGPCESYIHLFLITFGCNTTQFQMEEECLWNISSGDRTPG